MKKAVKNVRKTYPPNEATLELLRELSPLLVGIRKYKLVPLRRKDSKCGRVYGCCHWNPPFIHVRQDLDLDMAVSTLFHECLHAVAADRIFLVATKVLPKVLTGEDHELVNDSIEEEVVSHYENGIIRLFADNPLFLTYFNKCCRHAAK